jgi:hypothetical protein
MCSQASGPDLRALVVNGIAHVMRTETKPEMEY